MKVELKITCEESGNNAGFLIQRKDNEEVVNYEDLSREEQIRLLNMLATGYELFKRFLKEE